MRQNGNSISDQRNRCCTTGDADECCDICAAECGNDCCTPANEGCECCIDEHYQCCCCNCMRPICRVFCGVRNLFFGRNNSRNNSRAASHASVDDTSYIALNELNNITSTATPVVLPDANVQPMIAGGNNRRGYNLNHSNTMTSTITLVSEPDPDMDSETTVLLGPRTSEPGELPIIETKKTMGDSESDPTDKECLVCYEPVTAANPAVLSLCKCGINKRPYHLQCLLRWRAFSQQKTCPVCNQEIFFQSPELEAAEAEAANNTALRQT